ncbi:DNA polymerase III subunit alpha [Rubrobacter tropicus]|uniref:DNA-directed DNA polymerase n=1 Tax=Rubrobacter tropicus TaxID=2653851 RepID=A0A6G8Q4U9_9ACTN|nr:DNA polymerase III subunit alpha [Rubrobacter tropicus]QIN81524.1 DNA polymerase III subunit alpha [Rubrobacter tropicus]
MASHHFVHLHVRSGFSYGYGTATPEELVEEAAGMGMRSLALTDRDGLYGIPRFLEVAGEAGISPIVGAEICIEGGGYLVLLAEGMEGYRSLCRLITAYRCSSGDRRKPACPLATLLDHAEGLVCLTGAVPFGLVPRLVLSGQGARAERVADLLGEAFGRDGVFVELTDDGTAGSRRRMGQVAALARKRGLPVLATNEVSYLRPGDHRLHEVLVAASHLSRLPGPEYRPTDQLYLKTPEKMRRLFEDRPEALACAAAVAERCAGAVDLSGRVHVPAARVPRGSSAWRTIRRMAFAGARKRYGKAGEDPTLGEVAARLKRELGCIEKLGFAPYFLVACEAREIARSRGIPVTGRGSAANSLVSYCLELTQPEPFGNGLLFERFMHEGRKDPPDIDLDFCSLRRDEVRFEMVRRHERSGAAEAATVQTMSLRGAVRVAARALGHQPGEINDLSRHVPTRFRDRDRVYAGLDGWKEALSEPAMRNHPLQDVERYRLLLELSAGLLGRVREAGTHSGGMVFGTAERHLSELVPLEPSGKEGLLRCQYDKDDLERIGIPKLDLLGLRMHTALHRAGVLATKRTGRKVDPYDLPPEDGDTYALIRTGRNAGMFQLESPGQMHLSRRLRPEKFTDLVAQISLFRPGPVRGDLITPFIQRKNEEGRSAEILPELREVLRRTYGVLVYQEQVLAVANAVAGFSLTEGDMLRRAMTKDRGPGAMNGLRREFLDRAGEKGVTAVRASEVFSWMEGFSVYGFSAAHAASFAELSYASAYMRTHYPAEFFAALLNSQPMGFYSPRLLLNEARRIGLEVLPPDIHLSEAEFAVEAGAALRVGLRYCKGLSEKAISSILSGRRERPFASVTDLYGRTAVEKDSLENLIKGGFLDDLPGEPGRSRLLDEAMTLPKKRRRGEQPEIPLRHPASWWTTRERRGIEHLPLAETAREKMEWEVLGLNARRHPLLPYRAALRELGAVSSEEIRRLPHGTRARAAGLIECLQSPPTKSGHRVYFLLIEDESGLLQATLFRSAYQRCGDLLHREGAFLLEGRVEQTAARGFAFLVDSARSLREALAGAAVPTPRVTPSPGAFLRAGRRSRKAS